MADQGVASQEVHHTLSDPAFGSDMLSVLNQMRTDRVLLDVTVVAGEEEFMAHSTVLAYGSDYFRGLFTSGMKESQEKRVDLRDPSVTAEGFRRVLDFLYSGQLVVSTDNVFEILAVANHLQVLSVLQLCGEFIPQNMRDTRFDMAKYAKARQIADLYNLNALRESLDTVIAEDFMEISSSDNFLESTTRDELIRVLQFDNLAAPSEQQVYEAVLRWLMHDPTRMQHAASVLSHVRMALLEVGFLCTLLQTDLGTIQECRYLIMEAMAYHSLSPDAKHGLDWPRSNPRVKMEDKVLFALGSNMQILTLNGWDTSDRFTLGQRTAYAAAVVGNVLYVMGATYEFGQYGWRTESPSFMTYQPASNTWNTLSSPPDYHRMDPRMIAHGAMLFLVCGKIDHHNSKAWCFDIPAGQWRRSPPLDQYVRGVALASCQGGVFAIGGTVETTVDGKVSNMTTSTVQTFFPAKKAWETVSPTTQPHAGATARVQGDVIYIAGGKTVVNGQQSDNTIVEMCRVYVKDGMTASQWSVVPQPQSVHKFASQVAVIDRKAYFILGGQMHFTGKFVDPDHTSAVDVEDMCQWFQKNLQSGDVVCATLTLKIKD